MTTSAAFEDAVRDLFHFVPQLRLRRMFGGIGIYAGSLMFALGMDGGLYLKSDAQSAAVFDALGLQPFTWRDRRGRELEMSYRAAPDVMWDDEEAAREWTDRALAAARRKRK
jgi:DNA transformation protein and related proteins